MLGQLSVDNRRSVKRPVVLMSRLGGQGGNQGMEKLTLVRQRERALIPAESPGDLMRSGDVFSVLSARCTGVWSPLSVKIISLLEQTISV